MCVSQKEVMTPAKRISLVRWDLSRLLQERVPVLQAYRPVLLSRRISPHYEPTRFRPPKQTWPALSPEIIIGNPPHQHNGRMHVHSLDVFSEP